MKLSHKKRSDLRLSAAIALCIPVIFGVAANPLVAGPKASHATLDGHGREDGRQASVIFLYALDGDLRTIGPLLRFFFGAKLPEEQSNNELATTTAKRLARYQVFGPTLKARVFAGAEMKGEGFTVPGKMNVPRLLKGFWCSFPKRASQLSSLTSKVATRQLTTPAIYERAPDGRLVP